LVAVTVLVDKMDVEEKIRADDGVSAGDVPAESLDSIVRSNISEHVIALLSVADWVKQVSQEVSDLAEKFADKGQLMREYCRVCEGCREFGMEIYEVEGSDFGAFEDTDNYNEDEPPSSPVITLLNNSATQLSPPPPFPIPPGTALRLGASRNGITVIAPPLHTLRERQSDAKVLIGVDEESSAAIRRRSSTTEQRRKDSAVVFNWSLFSVKCWSYSKWSFSWVELGTELAYVVDTTEGYVISGLLMDYALSIVAETGSEVPCLKQQSIDQLGWRGGGSIKMEEGSLVNSLRVRERQKPVKKKIQATFGGDDDSDDDHPPEPEQPYGIRRTMTSVQIAWDAMPKRERIIRYEVKYNTRFGFGWNTAPPVSASKQEHPSLPSKEKRMFDSLPMCTITGLEKETSYVFTVRAMNDRGFWSEWSDVSEVIDTKAENRQDPKHLVVCCHGIAQNEGHMSYLEGLLVAGEGGAGKIAVLRSTANSALMATRDGVNIGGHRLALEIIQYVRGSARAKR